MGNLDRELDLRSFLKVRLDVRLLLKRVFTEDQHRLFTY